MAMTHLFTHSYLNTFVYESFQHKDSSKRQKNNLAFIPCDFKYPYIFTEINHRYLSTFTVEYIAIVWYHIKRKVGQCS